MSSIYQPRNRISVPFVCSTCGLERKGRQYGSGWCSVCEAAMAADQQAEEEEAETMRCRYCGVDAESGVCDACEAKWRTPHHTMAPTPEAPLPGPVTIDVYDLAAALAHQTALALTDYTDRYLRVTCGGSQIEIDQTGRIRTCWVPTYIDEQFVTDLMQIRGLVAIAMAAAKRAAR